MQNQKISYVLAGFVILFWGTSATAFKLTLGYFNFIQVLFWSSLFASFILFCVLLYQRRLNDVFRMTKSQLLWSIFLGFLNPFLYYFVLFQAYDRLPAQVAQPLNYIWPVMLVLFSVPILGQKLTIKNIVALLISFVGVIFISSQGSSSIFSKSDPLGVILAVSSSLIWALFWLYNVRDNKRDEVTKLFLNFLIASIISVIVGSFYDNFWVINTKGLAGSAYIGAFEMGITFVLWLKALSLATNTARLGNIIYLVPFVALMFISIVLKEHVFWTTIIGLILIIGGIIFQQVGNGKSKIST